MPHLADRLEADFVDYAERQSTPGPWDDWGTMKTIYAAVNHVRGVIGGMAWTGDDQADLRALVSALLAARAHYDQLWYDERGCGGGVFSWTIAWAEARLLESRAG